MSFLLACLSIGIRSPSMWQYPVITPTSSSHIEGTRSNSVTQSSDSMSNGSATPPTADHSTPQQTSLLNNGVGGDTKFVFPQNAIPISPGIFSGPAFFSACASSGVTPMTPTLLAPTASIEPYLRVPGQVYPFTMAPPIPGSLPKTPTLPPPSPHTVVGGGSFPITSSHGLPTSANLVNPPFGKNSIFMDEIPKFGGNFPVPPFTIMSPGGVSPRKTNGAGTTVFFPTTITANGDAKLTMVNMNGIFSPNHDVMGLDDGSRGPGSSSSIVKIEPNHSASCCVGDDV